MGWRPLQQQQCAVIVVRGVIGAHHSHAASIGDGILVSSPWRHAPCQHPAERPLMQQSVQLGAGLHNAGLRACRGPSSPPPARRHCCGAPAARPQRGPPPLWCTSHRQGSCEGCWLWWCREHRNRVTYRCTPCGMLLRIIIVAHPAACCYLLCGSSRCSSRTSQPASARAARAPAPCMRLRCGC